MPLAECSALVSSLIWRLPGNICVIDSGGIIVAVNDAWLRFAQDNGPVPRSTILPGSDYLAICESAAQLGDSDAAAVLGGLRRVLAGELSGFEYEYPCHSPEIERWFLLQANPLDAAQGGAVLCHSNSTGAHRARQQLDSHLEAEAAEIVCMCSACKRVRQEEQGWREVEDYLFEKYGERFSHGLCPECVERLYPELSEQVHADAPKPVGLK